MDDYTYLKDAFIDKNLLELALTHRSWVNEHKNQRRSNERLEFLGDAVLEFIVSEIIYNNYKDKEEGYLTALRAKLVNTVSLSEISEKLQLGKYLYLSKGEEETGGRSNQSLLADTLEAVIGAVYLDRGIDQCRAFIEKYILSDLNQISKEPLKDPKSLLQESVQAKGSTTPKYIVVEEKGPDHDKSFTIQVMVDNDVLGVGSGKSKSDAAQNAAKDALSKSL